MVVQINHRTMGGGGGNTKSMLTSTMMDFVDTTRISGDESRDFPPSLAALAGHKVTTTMASVEYQVTTSAWTTTHELLTPGLSVTSSGLWQQRRRV